jgi:hypothetical protein
LGEDNERGSKLPSRLSETTRTQNLITTPRLGKVTSNLFLALICAFGNGIGEVPVTSHTGVEVTSNLFLALISAFGNGVGEVPVASHTPSITLMEILEKTSLHLEHHIRQRMLTPHKAAGKQHRVGIVRTDSGRPERA